MSVMNCVRQRDVCYLITDSAVWQEGGVVVGFYPKTFTLPHLPAAIATRGPYAALVYAGTEMAKFKDFDELVGGVEEMMPQLHERMLPLFLGSVVDFDLLIAGWSKERGRTESYLMRTTDAVFGLSAEEEARGLEAGGLLPEPYKLLELDPLVVGPMIELEDARRAEIDERLASLEPEPLLHEMTKVLELQRQEKCRFPDGSQHHFVGGWVTSTTIKPSGVAQTIFHRWDDKIGEYIQPAPIDWERLRGVVKAAPNVTPLNRHMRRAQARKEKRL